MKTITICIPGRPVPAVRTTQRLKYIDPRYLKYAEYKTMTGYLVKKAMREIGFKFINIKKAVSVKADVYLATKHRIDVDNILKSLFDSCNKILWHDDSQVIEAYIKKHYVLNKEDECSCMEITILE